MSTATVSIDLPEPKDFETKTRRRSPINKVKKERVTTARHRLAESVRGTYIVTNIIDINPKRGKSGARFELYRDGMTVKEFLDAGGKSGDITWDVEREFIKLKNPETGDYIKLEEMKPTEAELPSTASIDEPSNVESE